MTKLYRKWKFHFHTADTNTDYDNDAIDADAADDNDANDTDANDINDDVTMMLMFMLLMIHDHEPNPQLYDTVQKQLYEYLFWNLLLRIFSF